MNSSTERLIKYCQIDTQSNPMCSDTPSTQKQFNLAKVLVEDLKALGIEDAYVDEHCYVYGHLPANCTSNAKTIAFIAHMDTSPEYSGENVKPRIIENYDGKDIELCPGVVTKVSDFPQMKSLQGKTLMVTDGSTLLGADDKAGIVAVMEALAYYQAHPEVKHGPMAIAFTPDEEIGAGTKCFDLDVLAADFGYTMDGGAIQVYCDETFNAASAVVKFQGFSIHPGSAKDKMINAMNVAHAFHDLLPKQMRPEYTCDRDGFFHLIRMEGNTDKSKLEYIIRDHDAKKLQEKIDLLHEITSFLQKQYTEETVTLEIKMSYRNMKEIIDQHPDVSRLALEGIRDLGYTPECEAARGGTDGAELSYRGLPCPNLGTGGGNFHGRYEYCCLEELVESTQLILNIMKRHYEENQA